ncbi:hypothetical protein KP509_21G040100 [Ceratopteris richardii]|uniref:Filament-like plant protein 4 n=1 Tax=Ceratopteris richardii TaxID=49495 RepID=A0A8T2SCH2_CERRI|nr:hypothetical protein KP509_21G040100 [Ceratopteris richardii]
MQDPSIAVDAEDTRLVLAENMRDQAEASLKALKEELANALKVVESKEVVAKYHEKAMEDVVAELEKAQKETLSYKHELEAATKQKVILEDRVAHLDGALKECMKQVRQVKEEHEKKIEETITNKTKEWEKIKGEVDAKQVELERRLLESEAQNTAMAKSLQERAKKILEANELKEKAESRVKVLQVELGSMEKEIVALKYELHVLSKELEIRNEEVECNKKAADAAHKQHLENVKKVAKLEADCQRLRNLVRKKLPGPAAIAQMRREVEGPSSREGLTPDTKRRPVKSLNSGSMSYPSSLKNDMTISNSEVELLKERMSSMEEETKVLKEALSRRNEELHASRLLCARTANKILSVESHVESPGDTQKEVRANGCDSNAITESSFMSVSDDANSGDVEEASCAESWATALISELAIFQKGKTTLKHADKEASEKAQEVSSAPLAAEATGANSCAENSHDDSSKIATEMNISAFKLQELYLLCKDLDCKFSSIVKQLKSVKLEQCKSETLQNEGAVKGMDENLIRSFNMTYEKYTELEKAIQGLSSEHQSKSNLSNLQAVSSTPSKVVSSLRTILCKLVMLLETILLQHKEKAGIKIQMDSDMSSEKGEEVSVADDFSSAAWAVQKQKLITSKNSFLEGRSTIMEFLTQYGILLCKACDSEPADLEELLLFVKTMSSCRPNDISTGGFLNELVIAQERLQEVIDSKAELDERFVSVSEELRETSSQLRESKELASLLESKLLDMENLEKAVSAVEAAKVELEQKFEGAQSEISKLKDSVTGLTCELAEEKRGHKAVKAKFEELEQQLQRQSVYEDECNGSKVPDDEDAHLSKERELAAAKEKLAECQRTILALGKQLSALSSPPTELSPGSSFDMFSMDSSSTMTMEQRMQMELQNGSMEHNVNANQTFHQSHPGGDGRHGGDSCNATQNGRRGACTTQVMQPSLSLGHPGWNNVINTGGSSRRSRTYSDEAQETPRSWASHGNGSFSKVTGSRTRSCEEVQHDPPQRGLTTHVSGSLPRTRYQHVSEVEQPMSQHYTYQQPPAGQPLRSHPAYVPSGCQYTQQRQYDGGPAWAPAYLPEDDEGQLPVSYSPPHTAMSSPARSPARYVQQLGAGRGHVRTTVRMSLAESMNAAAPLGSATAVVSHGVYATDCRPTPSKASGLGKLFSRSKNHR